MPQLKINDINIYYEVHGEGQPLVIIPGLRSDVSEYQHIIELLAKHYMVIAADNRGAGRTDKPDMPYTIELMAHDTAALLKAIGIASAHILGISMGGRIAAALTLQQPQLVKSLILVSTFLKPRPRNTREDRWTNILARAPSLQRREKYPQPYYAFVRQRDASRTFNCMDRLPEIHAPTLILHGDRDKLAPYAFAQEVQAGIKNSKMVTFSGGHLFAFFQPRQFTDAVLDFLATNNY